MIKMIQYNLKLPPGMLQAVKKACAGMPGNLREMGVYGEVSVSSFIRAAITAHLKEHKRFFERLRKEDLAYRRAKALAATKAEAKKETLQ
jgi:hypothetical protein